MIRALAAVAVSLSVLALPHDAAAAEPVGVRATIDRDSITLGDPILLTVAVEAGRGYRVVDPGVARTIGPFEVIETQSALQSSLSAGAMRTAFRYRITSFALGNLVLPPIGVRYVDASGVEGQAWTQALAITVAGVIGSGDDASAIRPLRPPLALAGGAAYSLARAITAAAALAAVACAAVLALRARRRRAQRRLARPAGTAARRGLEGVYALIEEHLPESGRFEEHYERLGAALRGYLAERYGIAAERRTALELRGDLERVGLDRLQSAFLFDLLREGEIVRFRHVAPSPRHANDMVRAALDYLKRAAAAEEYEELSAARAST